MRSSIFEQTVSNTIQNVNTFLQERVGREGMHLARTINSTISNTLPNGVQSSYDKTTSVFSNILEGVGGLVGSALNSVTEQIVSTEEKNNNEGK